MGVKKTVFLTSVVCLLALWGCGSSKPATFSTPDGNYQGTGKFTADMGSMNITADLVLNADKTYQLNIKELSSLGREVGNWSIQGNQITLTPDPSKEKNETLRAMSSNKQPHTVTINAENNEISWIDGPMSIQFKRAK